MVWPSLPGLLQLPAHCLCSTRQLLSTSKPCAVLQSAQLLSQRFPVPSAFFDFPRSGRFCFCLVSSSCSGSFQKDYLLPLHDALLIPIRNGYCGCIQVVHAAYISVHLCKTRSVNTYYIPWFRPKSNPRYIAKNATYRSTRSRRAPRPTHV